MLRLRIMETLLLISLGFYFCTGQCFFVDWFYFFTKDIFVFFYILLLLLLQSALYISVFVCWWYCFDFAFGVYCIYFFCSRVIMYVSFSVSYIYAGNYVLADVGGGATFLLMIDCLIDSWSLMKFLDLEISISRRKGLI